MASPVRKIVIVGGGSAGWITAGLIAAKHLPDGHEGLKVCVIEAPDIPIIGVGEGTWPTMRATLQKIGVSEADFVRQCNASFKQGSKFCRWRNDDPQDFYYHPFDLPEGYHEGNMAEYWLSVHDKVSFSRAVCAQEHICEQHLAPKQVTSPDYGGFANYGYHLDAGAFSVFLRDHCIANLGVEHIPDTMIAIQSADNGDIAAVETKNNGLVAGDLFVDCTGFRALLLGGHYGVGLKSMTDTLFPDTALAVQVPYGESDPVQSATVATAQPAGWIWDVSLSSRRGVGHVYSSAYMNEERAVDCVRSYLGLDEKSLAALSVRKLSIGSGYRKTFWQNNCVAVGLSAGFLEPLEASALMLIETAANTIADHMPTTRDAMDVVSSRFNRRVHGLWERIIHFLKLHYCLSERDEPFWRDNRAEGSMPEGLREDLALWKDQVPGRDEFSTSTEVFPPASYQYVLYGMGFHTAPSPRGVSNQLRAFGAATCDSVSRNAARLAPLLPANHSLLKAINGS